MTANPGIADWKRVEPRGLAIGRLLVRVLAGLRRRSLDRQLAEGVDPASSAALAHRARRLTRRRSRERLGRSVREVIAAAASPSQKLTSQIPPSRPETRAARPELEHIGDLLLSEVPVYAEGIARLTLLLTDAGSPLYSPEYPGALQNELQRILTALEGREEAW